MSGSAQNDNWDPHPGERRYYTHAQNGDRGYLVRRNGKDHIRRDLPGEEKIVRFSDVWVADHAHRPLNVSQLAMVIYSADQELCRVMGLHSKLKKWIDLGEEERARWIQGEGPKGPDIRTRLHSAMWDVLQELSK